MNRLIETIIPSRVRLQRAFAALCGLVWLLGPTCADAEETLPQWYPLDGPAGRITHLAAASNGTELYAVSVVSVNRRDDQTQWHDTGTPSHSEALYRSEDAGATWQPATNDLPPGLITALATDDVNGDLLLGLQEAGASSGGRSPLWRSRDGGLNWEPLPLVLPPAQADDVLIRQITRSANGRYLLLGATAGDERASSFVYRSGDNGQTWTVFSVMQDEQQPRSILADLIPHPTRGDRFFVTTYAGDLLISEDAGASWHLTAERDDRTDTGVNPPQLAFRPDVPDHALLVSGQTATGAGALRVARSTDGGLVWQDIGVSGLPSRGAPRDLIALRGGTYLLNTTTGTFRSADGGSTWQPLEGPLSSGGVAAFLAPGAAMGSSLPRTAADVLAATGDGVYVSRDDGAVWEPSGVGLPFNSKIAGLLTHSALVDEVFAVSDSASLWGTVPPPMILRSIDGGRRWAPTATGLPDVQVTAWGRDPSDPGTLFAASWEYVFRSTDAGLSWQVARLEPSAHIAIAVAPSEGNVVYLGGLPASRSTDRGVTWQSMPVSLPGEAQQTRDVNGLVVAPDDATHLWAALDGGGVYESRDAGRSWQHDGLAGRPVRWLAAGVASQGWVLLYAGVAEDGIYRRDAAGWTATSDGLPTGSTFLAFVADPRTSGLLWAARDGGGIYRSSDGGEEWTNVAAGAGDNLVQALAVDYSVPDGVLVGTATAGVWALRPAVKLTPPPQTSSVAPAKIATGRTGVDARIEVVWPHDWAPVTAAKEANVGLRLFIPSSLMPPACGWQPKVTVWRALNTDPAEPLALAQQRTVDGQPFPYWELNDVDVSRANDSLQKLYFMVRVEGVETATSVWAHGADARTYFPQPDVPSGTATEKVDAVDARIQIVWPHDEAGQPRSVREGTLANVLVTFFQHGTRISVPVGWKPAGLALYGAWDQEVGKPLSREAVASTRQAGAISYPVWEFTNIPVARATAPADGVDAAGSTLYLWVQVDGVRTYPSIWAHGADARTHFPAKDEPIQGCIP